MAGDETGNGAGSTLHNDEPTLRDRLRREALIEEVGEAVAPCKPPQVFGRGDPEPGAATDPTDPNLAVFPDPTAANVFWIGDIVRDLPAEVALETFAPYLEAKAP